MCKGIVRSRQSCFEHGLGTLVTVMSSTLKRSFAEDSLDAPVRIFVKELINLELPLNNARRALFISLRFIPGKLKSRQIR